MANLKSLILLPLFCWVLTLGASAQTTDAKVEPIEAGPSLNGTIDAMNRHNVLNHMDVSANFGTTGFGLNLAMPVTDYARVRAGLNYTPRIHVPMTFNLMSYAGQDSDPNADDITKFNRLAEIMKEFTGMEVDRKVKMNAKGTMVDFKFLVDVFPFKNNRHFYATAGFYLGSSRVAHVENDISEAPSLLGVKMYNKYYDYFANYTYYDEPLYAGVNIHPEIGGMLREKFMRYGRVGAHVGEFNDSGDKYMMEPDENGMVRADMYVNHFKPFIGIGYTTTASKDGRWTVGFEVGALYWGKPQILSHERYYYDTKTKEYGYGTIIDNEPDEEGNIRYEIGRPIDLASDVHNIKHKVGAYVNVAKVMHLYPVVNFTIALKLF